MTDKYIVGVDLGGTKIATAVATKEGKVLNQLNIPTLAEKGPDVVISRIVNSIENLLSDLKIEKSQISSLCIGVPGHVNAEKGKVYKAPNLADWNNIPLKKILKTHFDTNIIIENDANAAALGEFKLGAGKGSSNMFFITISTGVGAGIILNNKLYHGSNNSAGEVGHMTFNPEGPRCGCGNTGCFEAYASGPAMAARAIGKLKKSAKLTAEAKILIDLVDGELDKIDAKTLSEAAKKGDKFSLEQIKENAYYIGIGLVNIINILDPELIVIGGGVSQIGEILFDEIRNAINKRCTMNVDSIAPVVPAQLGTDAGILGAISLGM
ncbi:MAG: ROK family protein [Candidatus Margulisiibacteriota bacterium]|nr:MAG: ROK family protein [Candidatus Margulisiibacteriota bacterium]HCY36278.1 transcriptional regulator [Candidatus Margulisiibacteriota bacterium]